MTGSTSGGPPRPALSLANPAHLLSTWFGCGLLPGAPGTWGSLGALPAAALIAWLGGPWLLLVASLGLLGLGLWSSARTAAALGSHDPGPVVIDEVVGQWLAILPVSQAYLFYIPAFVAFRAFDILKPWPVSWADKRLPGAWGIMLDDVIAGLYAAAVVYALLWLIG